MLAAKRVPDAGTTAVVSFAVVIAIYVTAFVAFVSVVEQPAHGQRDAPALDASAEAGLVDMLGTAGFQVSAGVAAKSWQQDPDNITRFGLAAEGTPNRLDLDKLRNITRGGIEAQVNGLLDYEEARAALGLGDYDFHLRTYPLFDPLADAGPRPIKGLDVAYVGDYTSVPGGAQSNYPVQNTSGYVDGGSIVWVNVTITNNGTTPSIFKADYSVPAEDGVMEDGDAWTPLLAPGASHTVSLKLFKQPTWEWEENSGLVDSNISVTIRDPTKVVGQVKVNLAAVNMNSPDYPGEYGAITVDPDKWSYKSNQFAKVSFKVWKPDGNWESSPTVNITVRNMTSGAIVDQYQGQGSGSQKYQLCCKLPAGNYSVVIYRPTDPTLNATETLVITDGSEGSFTSGAAEVITESYASAYERGVLGSLVDGWTNSTYASGGDVYRDLAYDMNNDLATNLSNGIIDILVVGSNVNQNAMTDGAAKEALKEFVRRGGTLIVLGSTDQDVGWLEPLFASSLTTSGDGLGAPDQSNPILHVPEELDWKSYPDNTHTWRFDSDADASHFSHVIVRDAANRDDILSLSKPGHFGNGTIVLSGWTPYALTSPQSFLEAQKVLYNFLLRSQAPLYVDFGPSIPPYTEVASSSRMATAPSQVLPGEEILVRVQFFVFR